MTVFIGILYCIRKQIKQNLLYTHGIPIHPAVFWLLYTGCVSQLMAVRIGADDLRHLLQYAVNPKLILTERYAARFNLGHIQHFID